MNILLLNPPGYDHKFFIREGRCNQEQGVWGTIWPPITLATSAAMLENKGYFVEVLDCSAQKTSLDNLLNSVRRNTYQFIIWTVGTPSIKRDLELADIIKQIKPETRTAIVGTHATALPDDCLLNTAGLDFVIRNEPEETILALIECISLNKSIKEVSGISYKTQNGKVIHNNERPFIKNLDSLPFPAWNYLDLNKYKLPLIGKKFVILSPVRGCPFSCIFCTAQSYYGKQLRKRSPERMIDEIIHNYKTYNVDHFFIWADTFTADKKYVMKFCQLIIEKKLRIKWTCNSRVDTVSEVLLNIMAKAGCWMISYGIESGNQHILDAIQKKITLDQSYKAVKLAQKAGLKVAGHFILGFPGETKKTLESTIKFAISLNMDIVQFYTAVPFPGSPLYKISMDKGWISNKTFEEFRQDKAVMSLPNLPPSVVDEYRKKGYVKFYMRPHQLLKILKLFHLRTIFQTITKGVSFIRWMH
jgi:radical SAM superfamily enzyme YgiQ (UPF0313 family)